MTSLISGSHQPTANLDPCTCPSCHQETAFFLGTFIGACVFATCSEIDRGNHLAAVVYGMLGVVFVGIRVALRRIAREKRP